MTSEVEYKCNNCGHEGLNTRAVPDVPELVTVAYGTDENNKGEPLVRSDQASAMLAAKDAEIERLREKYREAVRNAFKDPNAALSGKEPT